ncbi:MAG: SMP-30/gluconolactonase/LRE family protein [Saprospiraceae bacterium]|nr:SMP-30/gluconolactonase/LRE family protein [Saprospiraceae bacterium]
MQRRDFVRSATTTTFGFSIFANKYLQTGKMGISGLYENLKTKDFLGKVKIVTEIPAVEVFTEGPAADHNGNVYFTNIRTEKILKWDVHDKTLTDFWQNSNQANGLRFKSKDQLLVCEGSSGAVSEIEIGTQKRTVLVDTFNGKKLQSPNDLDIDSQGRIYFSSRSDNADLSVQNKKGVYRLDPDGRLTQLLVEPEIDMPNGIVISPDEKTLYLIEAHSGSGRNRCILAFDLQQNGSISNRRTLIDFYPGRSGDGMCIDQNGNLYVAAGLHQTRGTSETLDTRPGIHVISPEGQLLAFRQTPVDTITNCTFGGKDLKTLYITCGKYLLSIRTKIPGKH